MKNILVLATAASLSLLIGCSRPAQPPKANPVEDPGIQQETPTSFTVALPDGKKMIVTPDMSSPEMQITTLSVLKRDCERAVHDSKQADTPFLDRTIEVHVSDRTSYRDENGKVVRYKHEPEPVFKKLEIRDLGTVEITKQE